MMKDYCIRKALQEDKESILAFTRDTWDGYDYIPRVLDKWLSDQDADLLVLEVEGRVQGLTRTVHLPSGDRWLEGLRIAPEVRGQGWGKVLANYQLSSLRDQSNQPICMSTYYSNMSIPILEKQGFKRTHEFKCLYLEDCDQHQPTTSKQAGPLSRDNIINNLKSKGLLNHRVGCDWVFPILNETLVDQLIQRNEVFFVEGDDVVIITNLYAKDPLVSIIGITKSNYQSVLGIARSEAIKRGFEDITLMTDDDDLIKCLKSVGFNSENDEVRDVFLYEG